MRRRAALVVLAVAALAGLAHAQQPPGARVAGDRPACVDVAFAALYRGVAYNHVVTIHNTCGQPARCTVTTDVNPSPMSVSVAAGATAQVATFIGSPARVFVPTVACSLGR